MRFMRHKIVLSIFLVFAVVLLIKADLTPGGGRTSLKKEILSLRGKNAAGRPFSSGVKIGDLVFVSGVIGTDLETNELVSPHVAGQTQKCLEKVNLVLNQADLDLKSVVFVTVYLTDLGDYEEMNKAYVRYFPEDPPARACVQVAGLVHGARIEIAAIAAR